LPLPEVPSGQSTRHVLGVAGDRTACPALRPSSACQFTLDAGDVVKLTVAVVVALAVIVCDSGDTLLMRGPRPPEGLTISSVCVTERTVDAWLQETVNVTRRKSSPLRSGRALVSAGVQRFAGAVVSIPSAGESSVQTVSAIVYVTPRRSIVQGVPVPSPLALMAVAIAAGVAVS